jgi:hypothetical protein
MKLYRPPASILWQALLNYFKNQAGGQAVIDALNRSAEYFAQMWEKCERQKTQVR